MAQNNGALYGTAAIGVSVTAGIRRRRHLQGWRWIPLTAYKNILLGFDDSKYSRAALVETLSWAKAHDSKVTIVHAVFFDSEEFSISPGQLEDRLCQGKECLRKSRRGLFARFRRATSNTW